MTLFDQESIAAGITTRFIGRHLIFRPSVGSTQDIARELALHGEPEGALVIADEQSAGRGRLARRWVAPAGSSLLMSLLLRPRLAPTYLHRLTMVCSLGIVDAIRETTGLEVGIKWPNDVVTLPPSRKMAGLLTESGFIGERMDYAVVGMGINVNLDVADLPETITPATSLSAELGIEADRLAILWATLRNIETWYLALTHPAPSAPAADPILAAWSSRLVTLGQQVHVSSGEDAIDGLAESVDASGALLVRLADDVQCRITVGDVSLRRRSISAP